MDIANFFDDADNRDLILDVHGTEIFKQNGTSFKAVIDRASAQDENLGAYSVEWIMRGGTPDILSLATQEIVSWNGQMYRVSSIMPDDAIGWHKALMLCVD